VQDRYGRKAVAGVVSLRGGASFGAGAGSGAPQTDAGRESELPRSGLGTESARSVDPRSALLLPEDVELPLAEPVRVRSVGEPQRSDRPGPEATVTRPSAGGPRIGPYRFFGETIERVNALFTEGAAGAADTPARVTPIVPLVWILDEIGPLELKRGEGFLPALEELERARAASQAVRALIVVRPSLVEQVYRRLTERALSRGGGQVYGDRSGSALPADASWSAVRRYTLTAAGRDLAPAELLRLLQL
jgi:hypothetical protein